MNIEKTKKIIDLIIKVLTVISGFLVGMGSATACEMLSVL